MRVYSVELTIRLLRSYLDFKHFLHGQGQRLMEGGPQSDVVHEGELPFGMTRRDRQPWPFREPRHARTPRNGKRRAQQITELWVSMLDIEEGLKGLQDDDLQLVYRFHIFQTHTLDELAAERGGVTRPAMSQRLRRAVERLVVEIEKPKSVRREGT